MLAVKYLRSCFKFYVTYAQDYSFSGESISPFRRELNMKCNNGIFHLSIESTSLRRNQVFCIDQYYDVEKTSLVVSASHDAAAT